MLLGALVPFLVAVTHATTDIGAVCGQVIVQGYRYCEISHNDEVISYDGPGKQVFTNLRFGLITYHCDHEAGYFMSKIDCENCDLECTEEEVEEHHPCKADPTQFWTGVIMGLLVSVCTGCFIVSLLWRAVDPVRADRSDTSGTSISTIDRHDEVSLKTDEDGGAGNRDECRNGNGSYAGSGVSRNGSRLPDCDDRDRHKRPLHKNTPKKTFASAIAGLLLFGTSDACNRSKPSLEHKFSLFLTKSNCFRASHILPEMRFEKVTSNDHEISCSALDLSSGGEACSLDCIKDVVSEQAPCRFDLSQLWAGLILGVFVSVLIGSVSFKILWHALQGNQSRNAHRKYNADIYTSNEKNCVLREDDYRAEKGYRLHKKKRGTVSKMTSTVSEQPRRALASFGGNSITTCKVPQEGASNRNHILSLFKERTVEVFRTTLRNTITSVITATLLIGSAKACNVLVTMDSGNVTMFCQEALCSAQPLPFLVHKGHEICIEDHFGARVSLHVSDINWRVRYELAYYTTDYTINIFSESKCCSGASESDCWAEYGYCHMRARRKLLSRHKGETETDYQCLWANQNKLYVNCAYLSRTERRGDLYAVLRKTMEVGEIKFYVKEGYYSREMTLSEYNPNYSLNLTRFKMQAIDTIPIIVLDSLPRTSPNRSLLRWGEKFYFVNSSEEHKPVLDVIGDYQVSLNRIDERFARPGITCEAMTGTCFCKCFNRRNSTVRAFLNRRADHEQPKNFIVRKSDLSIIETYETHDTGAVRVQLGNWGGTWGQKSGKCDISYFGSQGCTSCNDRGSIVFKALNIEKVGLIPFHSNCSFDRYTIKCDFEPTKLTLRNPSRACYFRMPTINKQFNVSVKYFNFGQVKPTGQSNNCKRVFLSIGEALENLVTGETFLTAFFATVALSLVSFLLVPIFFRMIYSRKKIFSVNSSDDLLDI